MIKRDQSSFLLDIKMENFDDVSEPLEVDEKSTLINKKQRRQSISYTTWANTQADDYEA